MAGTPHRTKICSVVYSRHEIPAHFDFPTPDRILELYWTGIVAGEPGWTLQTPEPESTAVAGAGEGRLLRAAIYYEIAPARVDQSLPRRLFVGPRRNACLQMELVSWLHDAYTDGALTQYVMLNLAFHDDIDFYDEAAEVLLCSAGYYGECHAAAALGLPGPDVAPGRIELAQGEWMYHPS